MKRVGLIIGQLSWGGAERQLYELAIRLHRENFKPFIYCLSEDVFPYSSMLIDSGIEVRVIPRKSHFDIGRAWRLRSWLNRDCIDIAHSWLIDDDAYNALAHVFHRRPWIASMRSRPTERDPIRKRIDRWALRSAPLIIVNERQVIDYLMREYGCDRARIRLIPNGIDLQRLMPVQSLDNVRSDLQTPMKEPVIIMAGRLEPVKRVELLIEAFSGFRRKNHAGYLWVVGNGSQKERLQAVSTEARMDEYIRFPGNRDDLPDLLHAADLFVLTSETEGLPNVVLEAMGCGLPVLVSPGSGCGDLIQQGQNGWLASDSDPRTFERMIESILSSPEECHQIGCQARKTIQESYSVDLMVSRMAQTYRGLLC
ncbi:MAG: glycosyltransferase [Candidatus Omnitrophica bacterium]|nr:glycosyltransferase [Candidatus Omnitrophota bacterium]